MSYKSTVYRVLIASPSDVNEERETTTRLIQHWNDINSYSKKIVLLPIKWETHSSPTFDVRPQEAINHQLVDSADLVIGIFWSKIGSDTGKEISGTIEEIKRAANNGKDVMIYFSKRGIDPSQIRIEQLQALNDFKKTVYKNALVENFISLVEFRDKLTRQLEFKIRDLQESNSDAKTNLEISFINQKTNQIIEESEIKMNTEFIELTNKEIDQILISNPEIGSRGNEFKSDLIKYTERVNKLPIVLGIKNSDSIIHADLNVDLELKSPGETSASVNAIGSPDSQGIRRQLSKGTLMKEDEKNIYSLYTETLERIDKNTINVYTEPLTVLPNKVKCLKPLITFNAWNDTIVNFNLIVHSNSLLIPIRKSLVLNIEVSKRDITEEEVAGIIANLSEFDIFDMEYDA